MTELNRLRAIASTCFTRTFTHRQSGVLIDDDYPATLLLSSDCPEFFKALTGLSINEYRIDIDQARQSVHHVGRHSDPLFLIRDPNGNPAIEVNLYDLPWAVVREGMLQIEVQGQEYARIAIEGYGDQPDLSVLETELRQDGDAYALNIRANSDTEIIWQRMLNGHFVEDRKAIAPGTHLIAINPAFADWLGICVTNRSLYGAVEHKHMIVGELGLGSGRWFLDCRTGALLSPPLAKPMRYRALLVFCPDEACVPDAVMLCDWLANWDEVEIQYTDVNANKVSGVSAWLDSGIKHRLRLNKLDNQNADYPGQDTSAEGYIDYFLDIIAGNSAQGVNRQWLGARVNRGNPMGQASYGINYAYDHEWARSRSHDRSEQLQQAERYDRRRFVMRSIPCAACPTAIRDNCHNLLPKPFRLDRLWTEKVCRLRTALGYRYRDDK